MSILTMDDLEPSLDWVHIIVDPIKRPTVVALKNYSVAKNLAIKDTNNGFVISISPETLTKLANGELSEIIV